MTHFEVFRNALFAPLATCGLERKIFFLLQERKKKRRSPKIKNVIVGARKITVLLTIEKTGERENWVLSFGPGFTLVFSRAARRGLMLHFFSSLENKNRLQTIYARNFVLIACAAFMTAKKCFSVNLGLPSFPEETSYPFSAFPWDWVSGMYTRDSW